jgi:glycolate oxidase iron-sulfur subunit
VTAFDTHRPPEQEVVEDCVHCGFCLDACPTYVLWAQEADSPRGRIVLVDEGLHGATEISDEMVAHFDSCLGCMACVTACPSGVRYDRLIERVRPQIERHYRRPRLERVMRRLLFETLPHPKRLRALAPAMIAARKLGAEKLPDALSAPLKVAPRTTIGELRRTRVPARTAAVGEQRGRVGVLLGCVQRVFFAGVNRATIEMLAAEGYEVLAPAVSDCCGALELHAGAEEAALAHARETIAAFDALGELDHIVVNAAGCGTAMKEYGELLGTEQARRFAERVVDVSELLAAVEPRAPRGPVSLRVAYHDACHLAHTQRIREQPRELLRGIPGLELLNVATEPELCCGSAGIYNLVQPEAAAALGARKARNLLATGAEAIAAGNPGCTAQISLHLRRLGHPLPVYHPIELLWQSVRTASGENGSPSSNSLR